MTYQALARKWRPQDFASLVGQDAVVTALRNALVEGRIAQAYLFSGIRGVGKTTAARVLAKALNCENGPAADPCNACLPCREITAGGDLDVLEIDAATYSKVEQVRELTESLKYGPARDRYKVVVLDEVHRLSRQAFDALLKIVEEPPPHLVFVFATTEIEAVPATILSRCQEFHFRRVAPARLAEHLAAIADAESISISPAALTLVARAGEGSVRDAVALLDQLATFGGGTVADADAQRLLGSLDPDLFFRAFSAILAGDAPTLLELLSGLEDEGTDPRHFFSGLLAYCRDALHLLLDAASEQLALPQDEARRLAAKARDTGYENLLRLLHQLLTSEALLRRSELPHLALEVALLKAAELPKLLRLEALLAGDPPATPHGGATGSREPSSTPTAPGPGTQHAAPVPSASPSNPSAATRPPAVATFLQAVSRQRQPLAAHLAEAQRLAFDEGCLTIFLNPGDHWLESALGRPGNRRALQAAAREVWGPETTWQLAEGESQPTDSSQPEPAPEEEALAAEPSVQAVLEIFNGSIQGVEPGPRSKEER